MHKAVVDKSHADGVVCYCVSVYHDNKGRRAPHSAGRRINCPVGNLNMNMRDYQ